MASIRTYTGIHIFIFMLSYLPIKISNYKNYKITVNIGVRKKNIMQLYKSNKTNRCRHR